MELIEQDVLANNTRLHVYRSATGRQPLVFAHGITDNGLCFLPIAEQVAGGFEIILYDARGHGKSDPSRPNTTFLDRANDLKGLIDALGLKKPGLIGHSMGAVTVALCAGMYPSLPGCLILEDPPPFAMLAQPTEEAKNGRTMWREFAAVNKQKSIAELIQVCQKENPTWPESERYPWALAKQQVSLTIFEEAFLEDVGAAGKIVVQIACPTLLITADPQRGALLPAEDADKWIASLPDGQHVNIPGAGHNIRREQPERYLNAVNAFLQEHYQSRS